jgi:hypothetical protein
MSDRLTLSYKEHDGVNISLDAYPPSYPSQDQGSSDRVHADSERVPALVFFHGGGLTAGNRLSWFPEWLRSVYLAVA